VGKAHSFAALDSGTSQKAGCEGQWSPLTVPESSTFVSKYLMTVQCTDNQHATSMREGHLNCYACTVKSTLKHTSKDSSVFSYEFHIFVYKKYGNKLLRF